MNCEKIVTYPEVTTLGFVCKEMLGMKTSVKIVRLPG